MSQEDLKVRVEILESRLSAMESGFNYVHSVMRQLRLDEYHSQRLLTNLLHLGDYIVEQVNDNPIMGCIEAVQLYLQNKFPEDFV